jgi:hypothetical protein
MVHSCLAQDVHVRAHQLAQAVAHDNILSKHKPKDEEWYAVYLQAA